MQRCVPLILAGAFAACVCADAGAASAAGRTVHRFMHVGISPDGRYVASVEGDESSAGGAPLIRDLVIRNIAASTVTTVNLPCGRVRECWPSSPAWTPDSKKLSWALRTPGTHKRSIYQVSADGTGLRQLLAFDGTLTGLRYGPAGELAMLAVEDATKELGAVEAGAALVGDLAGPPREQRIGVLEGGRLRWASPAGLFVYEYDWRPDGGGFVGTAAAGDGDRNWWVAKLYAFDAGSGQARLLYTPSGPQQQLASPKVSRDGEHIAFIAGLMSDFGVTGGDIYTVPMDGGAAIAVTPRLPASVTGLYWNCEGRLTATALAGAEAELIDFGEANAATAGRLLWHGQESVDTDATDMAGACPSGVAALSHESFRRAAEIETGRVAHWNDLTHANGGLSAPFRVQSISWKSDAFTVQGWLVQPDNAPAGGRWPLITIVHGGPARQFTPPSLRPATECCLSTATHCFSPIRAAATGRARLLPRPMFEISVTEICATFSAVSTRSSVAASPTGATGHCRTQLRRLHDHVGRDADQPLQSGGGRGGNQQLAVVLRRERH